MSMLTEIEAALDLLPRPEQEALLSYLSAKLRLPTSSSDNQIPKWPVPPPKVNKAESNRIMQRIEDEFGGVERADWK